MPGNPLPPGVKIIQGYGQWCGPDRAAASNELDVWGVGSDGKLYHWWLTIQPFEWQGPEVFG
jgi:hypothetical protein